MTHLNSSYLQQQRQHNGQHSKWQYKTYPTHAEQQAQVSTLANQPGLHSGNVDQKKLACTFIQCLTLLSSIQNRAVPALAASNQTALSVTDTLINTILPIKNVSQQTASAAFLMRTAQPTIPMHRNTEQFIAQRTSASMSEAESMRLDDVRRSRREVTSDKIPVNPTRMDSSIILPHFNKASFEGATFSELRNITHFSAQGRYFENQDGCMTRGGRYMNVRHEGKNYIIKETAPDTYYLLDPLSAKPHRTEIPVYFKSIDKQVHLGTDLPQGQYFHDETIDNAGQYIDVEGDLLQLNYNWDTGTPEAIISRGYLNTLTDKWHPESPTTCPVTWNSDSRTWQMRSNVTPQLCHLETQQTRLNQLSVIKNDAYDYLPVLNNNPSKYGKGTIYYAEQRGDASRYTQGKFILMRGQLLPVREDVLPEHGVHYVVYNVHQPDETTYPIQYQNGQWWFAE